MRAFIPISCHAAGGIPVADPGAEYGVKAVPPATGPQGLQECRISFLQVDPAPEPSSLGHQTTANQSPLPQPHLAVRRRESRAPRKKRRRERVYACSGFGVDPRLKRGSGPKDGPTRAFTAFARARTAASSGRVVGTVKTRLGPEVEATSTLLGVPAAQIVRGCSEGS